MPLTWLGVQERIQHIASKADRAEELRSCFGLDHKGLAEIQKAEGVSTRNLPIGAFSDNYKRRHCKWFRLAPPGHELSEKGGEFLRLKRRQEPAVRAPESSGPSSFGSTGQRAASSLSASAGTLARVEPRGSVAAVHPPLEGLSRESRAYRLMLMRRMGDHSNAKIYTLNKNARSKKAADGTKFLSHTDRWNRCSVYRTQKESDGCPKWLIYESGDTHRVDNQYGDEFPEQRG
jgi:hypothetical protein